MTAQQIEQAVMEFHLRHRQGPRPLTNIPEPVAHGGQKLEQENVRQVEVVADSARKRIRHSAEALQVAPASRQEAYQGLVVRQLEEGLVRHNAHDALRLLAQVFEPMRLVPLRLPKCCH